MNSILATDLSDAQALNMLVYAGMFVVLTRPSTWNLFPLERKPMMSRPIYVTKSKRAYAAQVNHSAIPSLRF
jgi:hypothetical protein